MLDHNLAVQAFRGKKLPGQAPCRSMKTKGPASGGPTSFNAFTRNLSRENARYGYRFEATETRDFSMTRTVRFPDGSRMRLDLRGLPFVRFEDNQAHCDGRYGINLGEGVDGVGPTPQHPFILRNTRIWQTHYAFRPQSPCVLADGMTIHTCKYGIYIPTISATSIAICISSARTMSRSIAGMMTTASSTAR